jgi:hypothetical protein
MKVVERKLGKEKVWGWAHIGENLIELDATMQGKQRLYVLIHEATHLLEPTWSETKVIKHSKKLTTLLWKQSYRKVDNKSKSKP